MAMASAAKVIEATYECAFNSHASFGPACAVVDPTKDQLIIWSGSQKIYDNRRGIADFLGMPVEKVRAIWVQRSGSYGRNECGDVTYEAALLASQVSRPVRLQWMRSDATAWDPKGPAAVFHMKAAIDAQGNLTALDYESRWPNANNWVASRETGPIETLVGQMAGARSIQRCVTGIQQVRQWGTTFRTNVRPRIRFLLGWNGSRRSVSPICVSRRARKPCLPVSPLLTRSLRR